ncbi:YceI family protein [Algisphaera agarilytica]|uniref:Polyisoprenoid-binding protein YceI n=1 Tax=Algisphaera agarilytica TaxID=1385975 RepID=A0A7X0LJ37_9BACT|nr:YceI family protein [Algisphaera agarilytica]MBB6428384.1 polyisoprenoid-binding protein YceI [Algisphaera agarilytica]
MNRLFPTPRWCQRLAVLTALVLLGGGSAMADETPETPAEQLIVFVQPGASELAERFASNDLPELEKLAKASGTALTVLEVGESAGVPEGVGITPLIAYQNHLGRSIYQGRYATPDRVRNFIRTSRFLPQEGATLVRESLPVWDLGNAKVATPIKVTDLVLGEGASAKGVEITAASMAEAIGSADERFVWQDRVDLGRSDRMFYTDYYPYLAADGTLYLSLGLYSQFHCHEPVFTLMDGSLKGPIDQADEVFARGAKILADEIARQLGESRLGDGFDVVPSGTPVVSWEELGLPLPPKPEGASAEALANVEIVREWVVDELAQNMRPAVQFKFPAPLDAYAGEVTSVSGELTLGEGLSLEGMRGRFVADPSTVTMGEEDLDDSIHTTMLEVDSHPESFFVIEKIETEFDQPAFGTVAAAVMHGQFTMKGITIPLSVPASIEAFLGEDGKPRLSIDGRWEVRLLDPFGIEGPPGDAPTNDTLIYTCHLVFEPA